MSQRPADQPAESPPDAALLAALLGLVRAAQAAQQQRAARPRTEADRAAQTQVALRLARLTPAQREALVQRIIEQLAPWTQELLEAQGDEGIDYSDLPSLGDDDAYWTGGRIGPVVPSTGAPGSRSR